MKKICALLFIYFFLHSEAWAGSYEIRVREIGSLHAPKKIYCVEKKPCFFNISSEKIKGTIIDIAVRIDTEFVHFQFACGSKILWTTSIGKKLLSVPIDHLQQKNIVSLYRPNTIASSDQQNSVRSSPVLRISGDVLTELEIFGTVK